MMIFFKIFFIIGILVGILCIIYIISLIKYTLENESRAWKKLVLPGYVFSLISSMFITAMCILGLLREFFKY